jgi:hypothetical protein
MKVYILTEEAGAQIREALECIIAVAQKQHFEDIAHTFGKRVRDRGMVMKLHKDKDGECEECKTIDEAEKDRAYAMSEWKNTINKLTTAEARIRALQEAGVFSKNDLNLLRQWYNCIEDCCHPEYLTDDDKNLMEKIRAWDTLLVAPL